jgi:TRAP transporter TAXI family solute receptor
VTKIAAYLFFLLILASTNVFADEPMTLLTGPQGGTYYTIGQDLSKNLKDDGITINPVISEGSTDNIKRLASDENIKLGIMQSDVLGFLGRSSNPESIKIANRLRMVLPFYKEEVHVLANKDIESVHDLTGKKIAIGEAGSGSMLTAINLFALLKINPEEIKKIRCQEGIVDVLKGDLDAVIFVGGKPVRMFKNMEDLSKPENQKYSLMLKNVHFLPLNEVKLYEEYEPAEISPQDYQFVHATVPTIAVQAALVTLDSVENDKKQCAAIGKVASAIKSELPKLHASGHPKWKEVEPNTKSGLWKKSACVN